MTITPHLPVALTDAEIGTGHVPVLCRQVVEALTPKSGGLYVDGTFGRGGYTQAILRHDDTRVIGIDRDPQAIAHGQQLQQRADLVGRLQVVEGCFGDMVALLADQGILAVDGVTLDLGVSSPQLDEAERGFSFMRDGPLDMRMSQHGRTAADLVNQMDEAELADLIYLYGEERRSRVIARAIVAARPITGTLQLAGVVHSVMRRSPDGIDTATRTFQALRIAVNDELGELERGLAAAEALLAPGGRLAVVSFHSLEDRIVKQFLRTRSGGDAGGSRHRPDAGPGRAPSFTLLSKKPLVADEEEARTNPRARSAKLRVAVRTEATAWSTKEAA